ncbi:MAG: hypothetical protein ACRDM9_10200, partial [Gaiellaceae bacterium]
VYNSGYHDPFGGFSPGPRFLVPVLPFLVLAMAPVLRRLPATTLALAAVSALLMIGVTVSGPLLAFDGRFHERIAEGWFNGRSWLTIVPFLVLATLSAVLAARATSGLSLTRREAGVAAGAIVAWALAAGATATLLESPDRGTRAVSLAAFGIAAAAVLATALLARLLRVDRGIGLYRLRLPAR